MGEKRFGIIGGGLTGLVAAYRLVQAGHKVVIYEASGTVGGLAAGFELAGHRVEQAYHFLYKTDEHILGLVEELGLADHLTYHKSSVSTYYDGVLYPMMSPIDLLRFKPLNFINRIRAGVTVLWLQKQKNWRKLSEITALDWLRKYAGRQVSDVIWEPLLKGKFDRYFDKVTMSWLWGRVLQRVDSRDAKLGGEALGYFAGGFAVLIDRLVRDIEAGGGEIRLNTPVHKLAHAAGTKGATVVTETGSQAYDQVLATVPSHILAAMISDYRDDDPDYFRKLESIDYLDAAVLAFATPQKITDYYWHNINTPDSPFVVFLSLTELVGAERFDGKHIYYIGDYIPREHPYMSMDADALKRHWYDELKGIFPDFAADQVIDDGLFRMRNAQHIVDIGFEENKLVPHQTPCPGVLMANFSQIYPMDRGTNYAVRDGNRMADAMIALTEAAATSGQMAANRPATDLSARLTTGQKAPKPARPGALARSGMGSALVALLALGTLVTASAGSLFVGFEMGFRQLPGFTLLRKVDRRLEKLVLSGDPDKLEDRSYSSALVRLVADVGHVATQRETGLWNPLAQVGGGLTSFGTEVLLLPYDGEIRAARSGSNIWTTGLRVPDNNRAAYQALIDDPEFERYNIYRDYLRYNDILHYQGEAGRGLVVSYTEFHPDTVCYTNTLAKLDIPATARSITEVQATQDDWTILHRTQPCLPFKDRFAALEGHMAGGRLAFQAPSTILMTSGDFHLDGMRSNGTGIAQDAAAEYGKVLAIDLISGVARILSSGHRNPQGIAIAANGEVYVVEHGPKGGDELNRLKDGANYGWPLESYGLTYSNSQLPEAATFGRHDGFEAPLHAWVPSVAISGLTTVKGFHAAWDGDLLAASMVGQALHRIRFAGDKVVYSETIPVGTRVRSLHQHSTGEIVLWSDNEELIFLTAEDIGGQDEQLRAFMAQANLSTREQNKLVAAVARCSECHSFAIGDHRNAPGLARIHGRDIASTEYAGYSDALQAAEGRWTSDRLAAFLSDPQGFAPGTSMPPLQDPDRALIDNIASYLDYVDARF